MIFLWCGFIVLVLLMLGLDLFVAHRKAHTVSLREALAWSGVWATVALLFAVFVYHGYERHWMGLGTTPDAVDGTINGGATATMKYLTAYVVEKSLSVDNIFVIAALFGAFSIPVMYQHRVLLWGVLGALVMRGVMIGVGAGLVTRYHWLLYLFGAFLLVTAVKMFFVKESGQPAGTKLVSLLRRWLPVSDRLHGQRFITRTANGWMLTPLALSLTAVEGMDAVFAVDSIPAVFAITADPFLVFTSNVFAMLGLRSLYFALAGLVDRFRYLRVSLAIVLALVGIKMLAHAPLERLLGDSFNPVMIGGIAVVLGVGMLASMGRSAAARA